MATLAALRDGTTDYMHSGTRGFPEGSFANGGAMRIAPVGLAYRSQLSLQPASDMQYACSLIHLPSNHLFA